MNKKQLAIATKLVHGCKGFDPHTGAISFPIYQSATFRHPGLNQSTGYDYSRLQNPTREELENTLASIENGKTGLAFSSGMAAISAVVELFNPGEHIIVTEDLYGGSYRLFEGLGKKQGLEFSYIDTGNLETLKKNIKNNTKGLFIETPSNPMMKVTDIKKISGLAKESGITTIVDNTFLSPFFQRPLELGADIVVHSGTKYLGGHNDALAGFIVVNDDKLADKLKLIQMTTGAVLAPFDSWLIQRGIKTLGIRLEKQEQNAKKVAAWLKTNEHVEKVYYVGLTEHEGYEVSKSQASGFGAMISFTVRDKSVVDKILSNVKVIAFAESLGGVESLITYPSVQTHASIPEEIRNRIGVTDRLLRLSVGIEDYEDIINDLEQAMR